MLKEELHSLASVGRPALLIFMALAFSGHILGQGSAVQLLNEGSAYQSADDVSDRAALSYRLTIQKYSKTVQAEQAQYFLGTYYEKKFFLLEGRNKSQDWSSFNQAEDAFYAYVGKYRTRGTKSYLADSYFNLAIISLRRGFSDKDYRGTVNKLLGQMNDVARQDSKVYLTKIIWSPRSDDFIKKYCDTRALSSAAATAISSSSSFDAAVGKLTGWAQSNCH